MLCIGLTADREVDSDLAQGLDLSLQQLNSEYGSKRQHGPSIKGTFRCRSGESQFKLPPLWKQLWSEVAVPDSIDSAEPSKT
jgi:hypothetical protein